MTERESIGLWSTTAATNASVDPNINFAEGQLPSTVNNSARAEMAALARFYKDTNGSLTTAGSANAYTLTINQTWTAYANGQILSFKASFANTSTATLNVTNADATALGAKAIRGLGDSPLSANAIVSGGRYIVQYDTAANSSAGAWILVGGGSSLVPRISPGGRLTLAIATPVMTSSQAAQGTVYYAIAAHDQIPLYDGTNILPTTFTETSQATTDTTKSPAAVAANKNYDMFFWAGNNCTRGPAWSSDTARGTGAGTTELVFVKGLWLNANDITNGPAAQRGTYVGTIRSNGSSLIDYIFGSVASGGVAGSFGVWNAHNRVLTTTRVSDTGANYTYTTATIRQARASAGNQVSFVRGLAEDAVAASFIVQMSTAAAIGAAGQAGIGYNSTSAFEIYAILFAPTANGYSGMVTGFASYASAIGLTTISLNEKGDGTNANTFNSNSLSSLSVQLWQ